MNRQLQEGAERRTAQRQALASIRYEITAYLKYGDQDLDSTVSAVLALAERLK